MTASARILPHHDKEMIMRKKPNWIKATMMAAVALVAVAFLNAPAKADAAAAEATYKAKCAMCHVPDGKAETPTGKTMKAGAFPSQAVQEMSHGDFNPAATQAKRHIPAHTTPQHPPAQLHG